MLETGAVVAKFEYNLDSAIIDGYDRIAASAVTPGGMPAVLVADVPLRDGMPPAARLGDWVGWLCLAGMAGRLLWRSLAGSLERLRAQHRLVIIPPPLVGSSELAAFRLSSRRQLPCQRGHRSRKEPRHEQSI